MMNYLGLLIGMAVVTYIPRMIPLVLLQKIKLPSFINRVLEFIPAAVLAALIFPGILYSTDSIASAVAGGIIAAVLAFFRVNLLLVVSGGILGVFFWQLI